MELLTHAPKGTQDILPGQSEKWHAVESVMLSEASIHGFSEIRTPVFEHTDLFSRGVGETTDVVQKEMYTFLDKGGRSITLRPEGTAGAVRAVLEHALYNDGYPIKVDYLTSCYRYEAPQAGRLREFHQFGLEMIGTNEPIADAEIISIADSIFKRLGIKNLRLEINSIGCKECRAKYYDVLRSYFSEYKDKLCDTCLTRLEKNPMRILDCKSKVCSEIAADAPKITDYLCESCYEHFEKVKRYLTSDGIEYKINPSIVRGLDYYTNTVFEFISSDLGAQSTICGGGRYNGLAEEIGGKPIPALGFAAGLERLLMVMDAQKIELPTIPKCELYIASIGDEASLIAFNLKNRLQECSVVCDCDLCGRSLKAQMKYADKIGAKYTIVLGDDEIGSKSAFIKNMKTGEKKPISLGSNFTEAYTEIVSKDELLNL